MEIVCRVIPIPMRGKYSNLGTVLRPLIGTGLNITKARIVYAAPRENQARLDHEEFECMQPSKLITGTEKLIRIFGKWPSFHDSEVVSINLVRDEGREFTGPVATIVMHIFNIDVPIDHPERRNSLVTMVFFQVGALKLSGFSHQNAISKLVVTESYSDQYKQNMLDVSLCPGTGFDCTFRCSRVEISAVEPFIPRWGAYAES